MLTGESHARTNNIFQQRYFTLNMFCFPWLSHFTRRTLNHLVVIAVNEVIIGVDWKSLTIPACLPITTDYFPDTRALQNDYVVSDYNLLPDDVNADFAQQRAIYKKPLTTAEVFRELVSQRLAQGFQLIVLPPSSEAPQTSGSKAQANAAGSSLVGHRGPDMESTQEYFLSIGRVFHKISLCGSTITVTRYRPRHPYPPFNIHYRYRFHAPHHDTYEVSWVSFTTEKLENYNWNYLDHYICTRGDTDFALVEALKYWRFRVYLLPLNNTATKRIIEGAPHCDIYSSPGASDHTTMVEGYLKFVETIVNKIKRPNAKKPRSAVIGNSPFRERVGSNRLPDRPRPRSGSKVMERGRVSPAAEASQPMVIEAQNENGHDENEQSLMKDTSTYAEILEAMRHPVTGVGFLTTHPSLPSYTFVSADAVHWLINRLESANTIDKAVGVMNSILREQLICHASGDFSKSFVFGFYLYHMVQFDKDATDYLQPLGDLQSFENEWLEVEVRPPRIPVEEQTSLKSLTVPNAVTDREKSVPLFLRDTINIGYLQGELDNDYPLYKHMHLEIDVSSKSDRIEWGHARYQTVFRPDQAFELVVQWVTASGSIVSELLFGWQRKVQTCGLQMVPIPHDPLALPYSNKSDPLRGPIFIPLDIECLMKKKTYLFEEFREDTWADRLFLFQEAIAARFGFISCVVEPTNTKASNQVMQDHQYIHSTGAMFILIPSLAPRARNRLTSISQRRSGQMNRRYPMHTDVVPSPHEAYITRHVSGKNKDDYDNCRRMGFLWSWNHMISRRWRTTQNLDVFQMRLLRDFKEFCANSDQRLRNYWDRCWEIKEDASTLPI